jgi:hypothetical protein
MTEYEAGKSSGRWVAAEAGGQGAPAYRAAHEAENAEYGPSVRIPKPMKTLRSFGAPVTAAASVSATQGKHDEANRSGYESEDRQRDPCLERFERGPRREKGRGETEEDGGLTVGWGHGWPVRYGSVAFTPIWSASTLIRQPVRAASPPTPSAAPYSSPAAAPAAQAPAICAALPYVLRTNWLAPLSALFPAFLPAAQAPPSPQVDHDTCPLGSR